MPNEECEGTKGSHGESRSGREVNVNLVKSGYVESGARGRGIREWLDDSATTIPHQFATFATRIDVLVSLSGNAAAQIDRARVGVANWGRRCVLCPPDHRARAVHHGLQKSHHCGDARCSIRGMRTVWEHAPHPSMSAAMTPVGCPQSAQPRPRSTSTRPNPGV